MELSVTQLLNSPITVNRFFDLKTNRKIFSFFNLSFVMDQVNQEIYSMYAELTQEGETGGVSVHKFN